MTAAPPPVTQPNPVTQPRPNPVTQPNPVTHPTAPGGSYGSTNPADYNSQGNYIGDYTGYTYDVNGKPYYNGQPIDRMPQVGPERSGLYDLAPGRSYSFYDAGNPDSPNYNPDYKSPPIVTQPGYAPTQRLDLANRFQPLDTSISPQPGESFMQFASRAGFPVGYYGATAAMAAPGVLKHVVYQRIRQGRRVGTIYAK